MKTISAFYGTAIAAIAILLAALMFGGCAQTSKPAPADEAIPVIPTTMVYSIDAPNGIDRAAIAYSKPKSARPETFRIEGKSQTISLEQAFGDIETDTFDIFNQADLDLQTELTDAYLPDSRSNEISVLEAVACKSIQTHTPQNETTTFLAADKHACVFTKIAMPADYDGRIWHIWKHEGVTKLQVELFVQGPTYRTGSRKTLDCQQTGHWTVEVTTDNGDVLEVVDLEVI
jgi:Protein of unknown function (DUF2914)